MSFFIRRGRGRGTNRGRGKGLNVAESADSKLKRLDEEISSDSEDETKPKKHKAGDELATEEGESALKTRMRQAKLYLQKLDEREREKDDDEQIDSELIGERRQKDAVSKEVKRMQSQLADPPVEDIQKWSVLSGHRDCITCLVVSNDGGFAVSGAKNGEIIKWNLQTKSKLKILPGMSRKTRELRLPNMGLTGAVKALAICTDDKFLVCGGDDKMIHVFEFATMKRIKKFIKHRGAVTALSFREGTHELFSASADRSIKVWNLNEMGYVDSMFGHVDIVCSMDALSRERCITSGSRDRSIRIWKIAEESQLVFNAHNDCGSVDCVRLMNDQHFVTGADDGSISVWSVFKKKPACIQRNAHEGWVTSLATIKYSDFIVSGSNDGLVKIWICAPDYKSVNLLHSVPLNGFINDIQITEDMKNIVCAVSKNHKWGRWSEKIECANKIVIIPLKAIQSGSG